MSGLNVLRKAVSHFEENRVTFISPTLRFSVSMAAWRSKLYKVRELGEVHGESVFLVDDEFEFKGSFQIVGLVEAEHADTELRQRLTSQMENLREIRLQGVETREERQLVE